MKQKAHDNPEPIQAQGLQVQTLKPESGADTKPSCHTDSEALLYFADVMSVPFEAQGTKAPTP